MASNHVGNSPAVVIIGAGISGICTVIDLIRRNKSRDFVIIEKGTQVGGTWNDNKYPGCCCDVWSHLYSLSFEPNPGWTREYPGQEEIHQYLITIAQKWGLYRHIRFNTAVIEARWQDRDGVWLTSVQITGGKAAEYGEAILNTLLLIDESLGTSPFIIWVALAYTTGFTVGMVLIGRLSDIFGRRWFFIGCSVIPLIGNIIGASAQSVNALIAINTLNGLGGAGQLSFSVIIGELVPNKQRGPYNAVILFSCIPFAVFGPPTARNLYVKTELQWRWCYIMGAIVNLFAVTLFFFFYHPPTYKQLHVGGKSMLKQLGTLDWVGLFLFIVGQVLFLIGLNWGGGSYSWASAQVFCTLIIGIFTLIAFGFWETYSGSKYPLTPMRLFCNVRYDAIVACAGVAAMIYYPFSVLWPTVVGTFYTTDIFEVGWLSCSIGGGIALGELCGCICVRYVPRMKFQIIVATSVMCATAAGLATTNEHTRTRTVALMTTAATAAGYIEALCLSTMALVWEPEDIGLVAGVLGSVRTASGALGASLYSSVLTTQVTKNLPKYVIPAATAAGLPGSSLADLFAGITAGSFAGVKGITPAIIEVVQQATQHAYARSFYVVFLCTLPFGAIAMFAALFVPNVEDYLTNDVGRRLQGGQSADAATLEKNMETKTVDSTEAVKQ